MIRFGPAGIPTGCSGTEEGLKRVWELGLNAMEIEFVKGVYINEKKAGLIRSSAEDFGIKLSVHAPYFINFASQDKNKIKASKERVLKSARIAYALGAEVVVVHAGYYGNDKRRADVTIRAVCKEIYNTMKKRGWEVFLGLETMGKISQWGSLEEVVSLCSEIKGCVPVIDFAHLYARNGGKIDYKEIFKKIDVLDLKEVHSHFSGITFSLKGEKAHVPLGTGPEFKPLAEEIIRKNIDITIISESPLLERDAIEMKRIYEQIRAAK